MAKNSKKLRGFTIIELLVATVIIAILAVAIGVNFTKSEKKARDTRRVSDLNSIKKAMDLYYLDSKTFKVSAGTSNSGNGWFSKDYSGANSSIAYVLFSSKYLDDIVRDPSKKNSCDASDSCSSTQSAYQLYLGWDSTAGTNSDIDRVGIYCKMELGAGSGNNAVASGAGEDYAASNVGANYKLIVDRNVN